MYPKNLVILIFTILLIIAIAVANIPKCITIIFVTIDPLVDTGVMNTELYELLGHAQRCFKVIYIVCSLFLSIPLLMSNVANKYFIYGRYWTEWCNNLRCLIISSNTDDWMHEKTCYFKKHICTYVNPNDWHNCNNKKDKYYSLYCVTSLSGQLIRELRILYTLYMHIKSYTSYHTDSASQINGIIVVDTVLAFAKVALELIETTSVENKNTNWQHKHC